MEPAAVLDAHNYAMLDHSEKGGGIMGILRPRAVWISWRESRQRYEVGFNWEGKKYQFYSWLFNGHRYSFTEENKFVAEEFVNHIRALMRPNVDGLVIFEPSMVSGGKVKSIYRFGNYVDLWLEGYRQLAKVNKKNKEYVDHLYRYDRLYWRPFFKALDVRQINKPLIKKFYLYLCEKKLSKKYIQNIMDPLRSMLKEAFSEYRLQSPEFPDYKEKKNERKPIKWISEDSQDAVILATPKIHRPIVRIIGYHGLRMYEARDLRLTDIELFKSRNKQGEIKEKGIASIRTIKGGVPRSILLDSRVLKDIKSIPRCLNHDYIFHHNGAPYTKTTLWKIMRRALNDSGFSHITPSQYGRHSAASHILQRGGSTRLVQEILGHADIRTTERYTHILVDDQVSVQRRESKKGDDGRAENVNR